MPPLSDAERDRPFELAELARRLANVVRPAKVAEVDLETARLRAQYDTDAAGNPVLSAWLPWLTFRAGTDRTWWAPAAGEQLVLLAPDGDLAQAWALPAAYSAAHPAPSESADLSLAQWSDGAKLSYDRDGHVLQHTAEDGAVIKYDADAHRLFAVLPDAATTELDSKGGVTIRGDTDIYGDVTIYQRDSSDGDLTVKNGDILAEAGEVADEDGDMQEMRTTYNGHLHPAGNPPGTTGSPNQQMN